MLKLRHARRVGALGVALAAMMGSIGAASAEDYPSRPITIVVPYAAGGLFDSIARALAESMAQAREHLPEDLARRAHRRDEVGEDAMECRIVHRELLPSNRTAVVRGRSTIPRGRLRARPFAPRSQLRAWRPEAAQSRNRSA